MISVAAVDDVPNKAEEEEDKEEEEGSEPLGRYDDDDGPKEGVVD